ncbi:GNAT family N-acetyltransferase [Nocardioides ginkgobilobae]
MTGPLILRPFHLDDEAEARAAHHELAADGFGFLLFRDEAGTWAEYLAWLEEVRHGRSLRGRMVCSSLLVAEVDGALVGRVSIRHELNEFLATWGGHVGYGVRPAYRRRGYATAILRGSLEVLADLGVEEALVTCDLDNAASEATIRACGGFPDPELPLVGAGPTVSAKKRFLVPTSD